MTWGTFLPAGFKLRVAHFGSGCKRSGGKRKSPPRDGEMELET